VPLLIELARTAFKAGDPKGALGYLAHARELEPTDAAVHFLFGIVCVELNLGAEAHDSLAKAVALAPDNPDINYAMGAVSLHRHDPRRRSRISRPTCGCGPATRADGLRSARRST
jgi:Flp pilus assembly protein TadD